MNQQRQHIVHEAMPCHHVAGMGSREAGTPARRPVLPPVVCLPHACTLAPSFPSPSAPSPTLAGPPQVVLFLFQLEMDSQLQRALTYERFDMAQEVRGRREQVRLCRRRAAQWLAARPTARHLTALPGMRPAPPPQVDAALRELQQLKGPGCGARVAGRSDQMQYAPQIMTIKSQMAAAAEAERYDEAAALRDRLREVEAAAAAAAEQAAQYLCPVGEPRFCLGEMVVHSSKGYRGVVCGWDMGCCEGAEWREAAGVRCGGGLSLGTPASLPLIIHHAVALPVLATASQRAPARQPPHPFLLTHRAPTRTPPRPRPLPATQRAGPRRRPAVLSRAGGRARLAAGWRHPSRGVCG